MKSGSLKAEAPGLEAPDAGFFTWVRSTPSLRCSWRGREERWGWGTKQGLQAGEGWPHSLGPQFPASVKPCGLHQPPRLS